MSNILEIKNLSVDFKSEHGLVRAVNDISLTLPRGSSLGVVGESGSGKSVTALSIMNLLNRPPAQINSGEIWFQPRTQEPAQDLLKIQDSEIRKIRGKEIAMIFQEPMTSLNPVFRCGHQITEVIQLHQKRTFAEARLLTLELFKQVKLPDPERIFEAFPHQISGGQKQRVMIAMAISCRPSVLIADEPTTALDVTVQKAILGLLQEIRQNNGLSMIFISHDLGVISEVCDQVAVMYQGVVVESGPVRQIFEAPQHPYTKGLIACRPSLQRRLHRLPTISQFLDDHAFQARVVPAQETRERQSTLLAAEPLLKVDNLSIRYPGGKNWLGLPNRWVHAVDQVSFEVYAGETFGIAGESGCGKTTLGRAIARLTPASSGQVFFENQELLGLSEASFKPYRKAIQVVFQDPYSSLNPRMTIGKAIMEPMEVHRLHHDNQQRREKTVELLETVGLQADHFNRYPHEFSGGQRQRICLARALSLEPRFLVCDEMVSALDVSVQATILNLLMDLQAKFGLTYLFISHDLSVVKQMCDRLLVMQQGRENALGFPDDLYQSPPTPYVEKLIQAIPGI